MSLPEALNEFRLVAVVDWVKIRVTLTSPSQFRHVQSRMKDRFGKTYVTACDGDASSRRFIFSVQNPSGPDQLIQDLQDLVRPGDPPVTEADVEIIGVEVALDGYIKGSDRARLAAATGHFVKYLAQRPAGPPRATSPKRFRVPASARDLLQLIDEGVSINMGAIDADFRVRAYLKDYDTVAGDRIKLDDDQHRARVEVTLSGSQLPFTSIETWRRFRFEKLSAKRFAICRSVASTGLSKLIHERALQLGRAEDAYKIQPSNRRKRSVFTRRDSVTNDAIRQALESLTKRQSCRFSEKKLARTTTSSVAGTSLSPVVLNTLIEPSAPMLPGSILTTGGRKSQVHCEANSLLSKVIKPSKAKEFDTVLPEGWGAW